MDKRFVDKRWNMAEYAYQNVPLYRDKLREMGASWQEVAGRDEWNKLPVIEKNQIVKHADNLISEKYVADVAMERLIHTHTSGSTGTFLDVYWNKEDLHHSLLPLWVDRWKKAGIHARDRLCQFNTTLANDKVYEISGNTMVVSKDRLSPLYLEDTYRKIREFEPKWMILHPSMAFFLMEHARKMELPVLESLRYVELTGEMAWEGLRVELESSWGCVVNMHYGTMEVQSIGYEEGGRYRLYEQTTYVEVLDDEGKEVGEGESGNIYVTSLHNRVMPFVRYGIGDVGRIQSERKEEKWHRYLMLEKARKNDRIRLKEGESISADVLLKPVEMVNGYYQNVIYQFQAVQKSVSQMELFIVMDDEFGREKFMQLYKDVIQTTVVGDMDFTFTFSNCIRPQYNTGKIKWFVNEME